MKVYKLSYRRYVEDNILSTFLIGFFDSKEMALMVKKKYLNKPGFSENGDNFNIEEYELISSVTKVYYVQSEYFDSKNMCDIITEIGLYDNRMDAEIAVSKKKDERPAEIYTIDTYELNEPNWKEGFVDYE